MARQARKRSCTSIYHIMLRGIDKRNIFLDEQDKAVFLERLIKFKETGSYELYGYCFMDNHVHLLIKENEDIGTSIKRIAVGYVGWHNKKYDRFGHLFQNRYKSEPVESENYLITVLRYIHQNPVKAGMVEKVVDYKWSSYSEYVSAYQHKDNHIDDYIIRSCFKDLDSFDHYMNEKNSNECLDCNDIKRINDDDLTKSIVKYNINDFKKLSIKERNRVIKAIYLDTGASIRQLGRVIGVSKTIIENAVK